MTGNIKHREGLPSLSATDRTSAAAAGGLSSELMLLLREAAAERLASYRVQYCMHITDKSKNKGRGRKVVGAESQTHWND